MNSDAVAELTFRQKIDVSRPILVDVAAGLLALNAMVLFIWWFVAPSEIQSNGGHIFFIIAWPWMGYAIWRGYSLVRYMLLILIAIFVIEVLNPYPSMEFLQTMSFDEKITKIFCVSAILLLFMPQSHKWFKQIKKLTKDEDK